MPLVPGRARGDINSPAPPPPRYTPDGTWYWTGDRWIPAAEVLRPLPGPARAAPPAVEQRGLSGRWRPWLSGALAVVLVAAVTVGVLARRPALHSAPAPPAGRLFDLPFAHQVSSAGLRGTVTTEGIVETVTGVIDLTPARALHVVLHVGGAYLGEYLDSGGIGYQTQEAGGPWVAGTPVSFIDEALGWTGGPPPSGLRVVGDPVKAGERSWHLESSSGAQWWIGARTGDPLAFFYRNQQWALRLSFAGFGSQPAIMTPPQSNVSTLPVEGALRTAVTAPQMSIEVNAVQQAPPVLGSPPPGYRYEALQLSYQNDGPEPVTFDNSFTLTGEEGAQYQQSDSVDMTPTLPRNLILQRGQEVSGWDVFVVGRDTHDLTLRVGPQTDEENLDFLVSIPLG